MMRSENALIRGTSPPHFLNARRNYARVVAERLDVCVFSNRFPVVLFFKAIVYIATL